MRCYHEPPVPAFVGTIPNKVISNGPPVMVVLGMSPEVHPARFCRHHPALSKGSALDLPPMRAEPIVPTHADSGARN